MDISDDQGSSQLKGASKLFKERLQEQSFQIQGIPGFVTMTHRGDCTTCETYATHAIVAARSPMIAIPSYQIELTFWSAWPQVMTQIEDEAVDEAQGKLSWYQYQYEEATKSIKALEEKLSSEKTTATRQKQNNPSSKQSSITSEKRLIH